MYNIDNIIKDETIKFIEEFHQFQKLPINEHLNVIDKTRFFDWIKKHAPAKILDNEKNINWKYIDSNTGYDIFKIIDNFINMYFKLKNVDKIHVYKLIYSKSFDNNITKRLGIGWSLNENYLNDDVILNYDSSDNQFKISALIKFCDINFELTLYKHLDDSRNQYNCYLNKHTNCYIINVNDNELSTPIVGLS